MQKPEETVNKIISLSPQRIVCQGCETILQNGDATKGTKFMTCTDCIRKNTPGVDYSRIIGADGRRVPKEESSKVDVDFDYVMTQGKIFVQVIMTFPGGIKFDIGLSEEQVNNFSSEMKDIREQQELQKTLVENLD